MRNQITLLACVGLMLIVPILAGAEAWEKTADLGLNLTQSGYSNSWAGGESGSITWAFTGNLGAGKALSEKAHLQNTLKLQYGQTHAQDVDASSGERRWTSPEKSTDRVFFESLLRFTLGKAVDPFASATLESQFHDSNAPQKTFYLSPMTLNESVGVGRQVAKTETKEIFTRLGFSLRQHRSSMVVLADAGDPDGDFDTDSSTLTDGGFEWVTDHTQTFSEERMKVVNKLRLFKALFNSESDNLGDEWKTADIAFESSLSASVSKYIQVTMFVEFLYDEEISTKGRFRETLGLGLSYKLF